MARETVSANNLAIDSFVRSHSATPHRRSTDHDAPESKHTAVHLLEFVHRILEVLGVVLLCTVVFMEEGVTSARILEGLHRGLEVIGILILCAVVSIHHK